MPIAAIAAPSFPVADNAEAEYEPKGTPRCMWAGSAQSLIMNRGSVSGRLIVDRRHTVLYDGISSKAHRIAAQIVLKQIVPIERNIVESNWQDRDIYRRRKPLRRGKITWI